MAKADKAPSMGGKGGGKHGGMGKKEAGFGARLGKMGKGGKSSMEGPAEKGMCK